MQHSEPFENELELSTEDFNKCQQLCKYLLIGIITLPLTTIMICI